MTKIEEQESEAYNDMIEKQREAQLKEHLAQMNIYSLNNSFRNFNYRRKGVRESYVAFKALADGTTDKPFLLCYGGVGNGKTHLCEALVIRLYARKFRARYNTVSGVLALFRRAMNEWSDVMSLNQVTTSYINARYLILDDYGGAEYGTPWEASVIGGLISERYRAAKAGIMRVTVMCTNEDLSTLPERVLSRFSDPDVSVIVLNEGQDYRRRRRKQ